MRQATAGPGSGPGRAGEPGPADEAPARSGRSAAGAALAAGAIVAWSLLSDPPALGFAGIPIALGSTLAVLILAFRRGEEDTPRPSLWPLLLSAAVAAAVYWWRVWSHRNYGLEGVPLMVFFGVGFWWPGATVALASRLAHRGLRPMRLRGYAVVVVAAVGGAALGTGAYQLADEIYYSDRDRLPLEEAMVRVEGPDAPVPHGASVTAEHRGSTLQITLSVAGVEAGAYELLDEVHDYLETARGLVGRKDTDTVRVRVTTRGGTVATMVATDDDTDRPLAALVEIDRSELPGGGELRPADLAAMIQDGTLGYELPETEEAGPSGFRTEIAGDRVRIVFRPTGAPGPETVRTHVASWAAANHVVESTVRFFPRVREFRLDLPGLDTLLERHAFEAAGPVRLQSSLPRGRRIVALEVRALPASRAPPGPADERDGFEPGRFCPRGDETHAGARIAIVREHGAVTDHLAVDLYQRVPIGTGPLYLTAVRPDGTVAVLTGPWQGPLEGPESIAPGDTARVAAEEITNLGWFPPEAVTCHGRTVFDPEGGAP